MSEAVAVLFSLALTLGLMFFIFAYIAVIFVFVFAVIFLTFAGMIFWVFMLMDNLQRDAVEFPDKDNWTIGLVLTFMVGMAWLGALIYYFKVKRPIYVNGDPGKP